MLRIKTRRTMARNKAQYNIRERKKLQLQNRGWAWCKAKQVEAFLYHLRTRPNFVHKNFKKQMFRQEGSLYRRFMRAFSHNAMDVSYQEWIKYIWHLYEVLFPYIQECRGMTGMISFPQIQMPAIAHWMKELQAQGHTPNLISFDGVYLRDSGMLLEIYSIYL